MNVQAPLEIGLSISKSLIVDDLVLDDGMLVGKRTDEGSAKAPGLFVPESSGE